MAMDTSLEIMVLEAASLSDAVHADLCELVIDAVSDGASVGWVSMPAMSDASLYWQSVASQVEAGTIVLLVAPSSEGFSTLQRRVSGEIASSSRRRLRVPRARNPLTLA